MIRVTKNSKSKFFIYSGNALSSQASSQALHFETNLTGWLYTSAAEELSQGLAGTNPASGQRET